MDTRLKHAHRASQQWKCGEKAAHSDKVAQSRPRYSEAGGQRDIKTKGVKIKRGTIGQSELCIAELVIGGPTLTLMFALLISRGSRWLA